MTKYEWDRELKKNIHRLPEDEICRVMDYYDELFEDKIDEGQTESRIVGEFGNPVDVAYKIISEYDGELKSDTAGVIADNCVAKVEQSRKNNKAYSKEYDPDSVYTETSSFQPLLEDDKIVVDDRRVEKKAACDSIDGASLTESPLSFKPEYVKSAQSQDKKKSDKRTAKVVSFVICAIIFGGVYIGLLISMWAAIFSIGVAGFSCAAAGVVAIIPAISVINQSWGASVAQIGMCFVVFGFGLLLILLSGKLIKLGVKVTKKSFSVMHNWLSVKKAQNEEEN